MNVKSFMASMRMEQGRQEEQSEAGWSFLPFPSSPSLLLLSFPFSFPSLLIFFPFLPFLLSHPLSFPLPHPPTSFQSRSLFSFLLYSDYYGMLSKLFSCMHVAQTGSRGSFAPLFPFSIITTSPIQNIVTLLTAVPQFPHV